MHNLDFDPTYETLTPLTPLVQRVVCPNPGPFTFKGTATFLVGTNDVLIVDPGPRYEPHLAAIEAAVAGRTVRGVIVTHTHTDHSGSATDVAERFGVDTIGFGPHPSDEAPPLDEGIDFSAHISPEEAERFAAEFAALPDELKHEAHDRDFVPARRVADGDRVEVPGATLIAHHTPGHCSNHVAYRLVEERTLFSGDHIMGWATSVIAPPGGNMNDYLASLRAVLDLDIDTIRPTHGAHIAPPRPYVQFLLDHRLDRERQIIERLEAGDHRIADMVPTLYAAYDKRLWYPAAASVLAHLIGLSESGRVVCDDATPALSSRFELAR